jgi:hypothetical protein
MGQVPTIVFLGEPISTQHLYGRGPHRTTYMTAEGKRLGHELFDRIGRDTAERREAYRALFRAALDPGFVDGLRAATNGGWALGDERFKRQIANALGRRVAPLARGRPPKAKAERRQLNLL